MLVACSKLFGTQKYFSTKKNSKNKFLTFSNPWNFTTECSRVLPAPAETIPSTIHKFMMYYCFFSFFLHRSLFVYVSVSINNWNNNFMLMIFHSCRHWCCPFYYQQQQLTVDRTTALLCSISFKNYTQPVLCCFDNWLSTQQLKNGLRHYLQGTTTVTGLALVPTRHSLKR